MFDQDSAQRLEGADVYSTDGDKIGSVGQVYLDDSTGQPSWVTVSTGWFGTSESFVPLQNAELDSDGNLRVGYDKSVVKDAPRVDQDGHIEPAEEEQLYQHYGLSGTSGYTDTDTDRTGTDRTDAGYAAGTAGTAGAAGTTGTTGTDADYTDRDRTSGEYADTDGTTSMTRSEEQLHVGTEARETGRARLRKYVTTEEQTVSVPVQKEVLEVDRRPLSGDDARAAGAISDTDDQVEEVVLREERPVVDKETVAVEEVNVGKRTVTEDQQVTEQVRKEQIDVEGEDLDGTTDTTRDTR